jgi:hypothetical protein
MKVKICDGREIPVKDRDEAVFVVKEELKGWMQKGDRIGWFYSGVRQNEKHLPNYAAVVTSDGDVTDEYAVIIS